jgi:hypothetical protein
MTASSIRRRSAASVKEASICIVDDMGRIVKEVKVASEPEALLKVLGNPTTASSGSDWKAGPLSQWLFSALAEADMPAPSASNCRSRIATRLAAITKLR